MWPCIALGTMSEAKRGRLQPAASAPVTGEVEQDLVAAACGSVRQVLSGTLEAPAEYCQDHDEWALVVSGEASIEVDSQLLEVRAGDWVWLPAGTPHRLVRTQPGTSWVTVHLAVAAT